MPTETLQLSQHELYFLPPATPATAPATRVEIEVDGEMRVFLGRSEIYACHERSRSAVTLFYKEDLPNGVIFGVTNWPLKIPEPRTASEIAEVLKFRVQSPVVNRYWRATNGAFGVSFDSLGIALLHADDKVNSLGRVRFEAAEKWQNMNEFALWDQSTFLKFCQQLYSNENSSLHYALKWQNMNEEQKNSAAFGCKNGDWTTLCHLMSLAQKIITYHHGIFPFRHRTKSRLKVDSGAFREDWPRPTRGSYATILSVDYCCAICDIIKPSFRFREPLCHRDWRANSSNSQRYPRQLECTMPTAHEALEAQLELREFLRPHLSAPEIEALMRP